MRDLITYYRYADIPLRFSQMLILPDTMRQKYLETLYTHEREISILAYCLMPNHFHLVLKQLIDGGITRFVSNITNGYTKYFNTKYQRFGPLTQGTFKAVHIETDEQGIHVVRYVHLNPVTSFLIKLSELPNYPWSSFPEYMGVRRDGICDKELVQSFFRTIDQHKAFVYDQAEYARKLETIKHLTLDYEG